MTYLDTMPQEPEQVQSPQWGFNQLATNSIGPVSAADCGSSTTNTMIGNGGIPIMNM